MGLDELARGNALAAQEARMDFVEMATQGLELEEGDTLMELVEEQGWLTYAMVQAFQYKVWPQLMQDYVVVSSEQELAHPLADDLVMLGRTDVLAKSKDAGDLYIISYKTHKAWDERMAKDAQRDIQGLSEAWLIEREYGEAVFGIQMVHLLAGRRERGNDGQWQSESPLIYGYRKMGVSGEQWAHSYYWNDDSGAKHGLGKGWTKEPVWKAYEGGVDQWIYDLHNWLVQPEAGDVLARQFVVPPPYFRQTRHIDQWCNQTSAQEIQVENNVRMVNDATEGGQFLDRFFSMYRHSCTYPRDCQFVPICHEGASPDDVTLYKAREFNHPKEGE